MNDKSNSKPWYKEHIAVLTGFFIPIYLMLLIFILRRIFPFGNSGFLRMDMYHQYAPFFSEFYRKLHSGDSLLYSFNIGLGTNFASLYAYYLSSPINFLILFIPADYIIEFMTYGMVIKIGLSGAAFTYFLQKHTNTKNFSTSFFGIFYAMSAYITAYSWNIMWLDCIILFPLILLGLEELVKFNKGLFYTIVLALAIISNYYIAIMICIFLIIYFLCLLIIEKIQPKYILQKCFYFSIYSILAGALSAVILLPAALALSDTASGNFKFPTSVKSYFSIFEMLARHLPNVQTELGLDHWPNIYCGIIVLLLVPIYVSCKKISKREKCVYLFLMLFFYASFSTNILNYIWHGFHFPNSLPARQSFIYISLILLMSFKAYMMLDTIKLKTIYNVFWGIIAFIILAERHSATQETDIFHFSVFYISLIIIALYLGILYIYKKRNVTKLIFNILILTIISIEVAMNMSVTSISTINRTNYIKDNASITELINGISDDELFYRVEKASLKTKNDGAWNGYPSASIFSSTANANMSSMFKKLGLESSTNAYSYTGATPLIGSLFSVKYILSENSDHIGELFTLHSEAEYLRLYENSYALPLGFAVDSTFIDDWGINGSNPIDVQNNLTNAYGFGDIFDKVPSTTNDDTLTIIPERDGHLFVYVQNTSIITVNASIANRSTRQYPNVNRGFLVDLGFCYADDVITLTADKNENKDITLKASVYEFSEDTLAKLYHKLSANPFLITKTDSTSITGTINSDLDGYLFTSIPYEKNWTAVINGEAIETEAFKDSFIMIPISQGEHTITLSYKPAGIHIGIIISICSLIALISLEIFRKHFENRKNINNSGSNLIIDDMQD
jgi:Predicted membrane protein